MNNDKDSFRTVQADHQIEMNDSDTNEDSTLEIDLGENFLEYLEEDVEQIINDPEANNFLEQDWQLEPVQDPAYKVVAGGEDWAAIDVEDVMDLHVSIKRWILDAMATSTVMVTFLLRGAHLCNT